MSGSAAPNHAPAARRPLKVGLFLPFAETMLDGGTPRWADLRTMAQLAEDVGFDSLWFGDHLLAQFENGTFGCWECWSLVTAIAAVTHRVTLGPLVACTSYRNPALLAKMADTVDEISGGRLILGLGAGWHDPEYQAFGYPFDHRVGRFAEALQIIHGLLREGHVDFVGQYYQARECELRPRGPQSSRLPIMLGTRVGHGMLRLTAEYADIWNTDWVLPKDLSPYLAAIDAACVEVGRDPATMEHTVAVRIDLPGVLRHPFDWFDGQASGSTEELAALLRAYAALGITHLQVCLGPNTPAGIEGFAPVLALLDHG
jgi:alkanesulfonate monooxygenase SsuD/methylene tetrahydromethanopterin reductase-like flavin-dependent oxidoreductase (luciferase family)